MDNYILGPNDKVKISVYAEAGLTGEYVISSDGKISLPLVGNVSAAGKSVKQFQDELVAAYRDGGYLKDPKITAEVVSARPFFILGEVKDSRSVSLPEWHDGDERGRDCGWLYLPGRQRHGLYPPSWRSGGA